MKPRPARLARGFAAFAVALAASLANAAAEPAKPAAAVPQPIRIANLGVGLASMPQALAIERGIYRRNGIDLHKRSATGETSNSPPRPNRTVSRPERRNQRITLRAGK